MSDNEEINLKEHVNKLFESDKSITVLQVQNMVNVFNQKASDDPEVSHVIEDQIYKKFIQRIANKKFQTLEEIIEIAQNIIVLDDIDYPRWYA